MSQRGYPDCRDSRESGFREHRGRVARLEFIGSDKSVISALGEIGRRETITERLTRCDDCVKGGTRLIPMVVRRGDFVLSGRLRDLVIIAPDRATSSDVESIFNAPEGSLEIRFDRRRGERRQADRLPAREERRQRRDRRKLNVSERMRTVGWVLVFAEQRPHS